MIKRIFHTLCLLCLVSVPVHSQAAMEDYCSAPPYVTRNVAPNVMILMDNSQDMLNPAYTEDYTPNATKDNYIGYFKPQGCYSYGSNKFSEQLNTSVNPNRSYLHTETCPSTAPFRGNLLNWATMSRFDILQKVLIGGNSASKQGNAHTLVSITGSWSAKTFDGCTFTVNNANLTVADASAGSCSLLDDPKVPIASSPLERLIDFVITFIGRVYEAVSGTSQDILMAMAQTWEKFDLITKAWAAQLTVQPGVLNGTVGQAFSTTFIAGGGDKNYFSWSYTISPAAPWLSGPTLAPTTGNTRYYQATWSGTPTTPGDYTFTVTVSDDDGNTPVTRNYTISIDPLPVKINTNALPNGTVGASYWFELNGQGGVPPLSWTAAGLPAGLSLGSYASGTDTIYVISGTPTVAGTSNVTLTLLDSDSPQSSISKNLTLTIDAGLTITTNTLPNGQEGSDYSANLAGAGGTSPYTWSITAGALPSGISMNASGVFSGTLAAGTEGSYPLTIRLQDGDGIFVTRDYTLTVVSSAGHVQILADSPLPTAYKNVPYTYQMTAAGGIQPYTWSIVSGAPAGSPAMTINSSTGLISWTPSNNQDETYENIVIQIVGGGGVVDQKIFSVTSLRNAPSGRSSSFTVKVELLEEPLTDLNGNDIWDLGETYTDSNGNGVWDGKQGIFQKFWSTTNPRARWGLTSFKRQGNSTIVNVDSCIPASPASSFYTSIQNATATESSPLALGLYGDINYFGFNSPYGNGYSGCNNSDPIDNVPCRKNFILTITSGSDVTGTAFDSSEACNQSDPLVRNACFGFKTDLRNAAGKQNVYTYIVNTMGTANNSVLEAAALAGGGKYYHAANSTQLEAQLVTALTDILAQAASGTAVSVLTTSSRGIGSMIQSYFLPIRQISDREVSWTGYTQNIWIDPQDNLREDSVNDKQLKMGEDEVLRLFFATDTNETKAALFGTTADGTGGDLAACTPTIKPFDQVTYTWEAGNLLALKDPPDRTLFTSRNVVRGSSVSHTIDPTDADDLYPEFTTSMVNDPLKNALNAEVVNYTADNIIGYVRGECLETGVSGDTACGATPNTVFRDRRVPVDGGDANGNVWKLGDVISSTPKVLSNTPVNTYHIDYGDSSYFQYVRSTAYKQRSSIAFVGANDGILHAFRVGYLKDTGLAAGVKGALQNFFSGDTGTDKLGDEIWGYIPFNAFPYLKYLANPGYCHIYFNDLSVRLVDASIGDANDGPTDNRTVDSWRTILVGGMRFGGACTGGTPAPPGTVGFSSYYAIDVTDAEKPVPLWEFSDEDMGYATSFTSIVRTGGGGKNGHWYVAIGSGSKVLPKSSTDIGRNSTGYLYLLDLKTGAMVKKVDLGHNAIVGDILAIDADKDYGSERLYFGTSYTNTTWKGKLMSVAIPNQDLSDPDWTPSLTTLFDDDYPITASPDAARDTAGNIWVYAGSGKYNSDVDETDSAAQIFFGLKHLSNPNPAYPWDTDADDLVNQTNVATTGTVTGTATVCSYDPANNGFANRTLVTSINQTSSAVSTPARGWYLALQNGERVITRPLAVGGLVDFLTYKPSSDPCSYGGESYLYAVGYTTGVAPSKVAIRAPETTGGVTTGTVTVAKGILLGPGAPPTGEAIIIPPPKEGQEQLKKKIQIATGVIVEAENMPVISTISKIVHWLKK